MCAFILYIFVIYRCLCEITCLYIYKNIHIYKHVNLYTHIYICEDAEAVKSQQQMSGLLVPISWLLPVTHHELVDIADPRTDRESLESKCKREGKC